MGLIILLTLNCHSQTKAINHDEIKEDLEEILHDISKNYVYLEDKKIDLSCLKKHYTGEIKNIKTEEETVLFFEYLIDEFYDSHLNLRTHRPSSYRLYTSIHASIEDGNPIITNVWQTQIENLEQNLIGAKIIEFNGKNFQKAINDFPTHCNDKDDKDVKEWISNKILAGRYNQPRVLTLRLINGKVIKFDLDNINVQKSQNLVTYTTTNEIGIIKIENSLGNDKLVEVFDNALDDLMNTKGLVIDLRNTINGGDSYEARGIMGRFITEPKPYQKHQFFEKSYKDPQNHPKIERTWLEYVSPRGETYTQPVVVLVGRWTGSMGEGLAVGFEGIGRAEIVGSEMRRLAGEVFDFDFKHQSYGYKLSAAKLFHINGTIREKYIPTNYIRQTTITEDETLKKGVQLIRKSNNQTDSILKKELEFIGVEDQTLRLLLPEVKDEFGSKSDEYKYVWSLINQQDSICANKLVKILNTHGWVGKSRIVVKANQAIWLVMQHAKLKVQEKYLPLLKESVKNGESEGWHLAFLEDRILMYNKKKQVYGTQAVWDSDLKKNKIWPIEDVKNTNQRRKQLGLKPIEEYAKSNGYILDKRNKL